MFASMHNASQMTWYHTNIVTSSMMRHPFDGEVWKHFDRVHLDFAAEPINASLDYARMVLLLISNLQQFPILVSQLLLPHTISLLRCA